MDVENNSAAILAGIEQGDIITHFAGKAIDATFRQNQLLNELNPNNIYTISVFRSGKLVEIDVKMGELPNRNINTPPGQIEEYSNCSSEHFDEKLGLGLDRLTEDLATQLEFSQKIRRGHSCYLCGKAKSCIHGRYFCRYDNPTGKQPCDSRY